MKLDYFNIIKEGKKVNFNNINFSTLLNESLLDVRQKNASNLSDEEFKYLISFDPVLNNIQNLSNEVMASSPLNNNSTAPFIYKPGFFSPCNSFWFLFASLFF